MAALLISFDCFQRKSMTTIEDVATAATAATGLSKELIGVDKAVHEAELKIA
jgi:hypothetical protein